MCASFLPSLAESEPPWLVNESDGMMLRWRRRAEVSEVMRAAEEPRPVLWTSEIGTPVGRNLGRDCRDLSVGGRLRALSYINETIENVNNALS